jgi:hypothetical protein
VALNSLCGIYILVVATKKFSEAPAETLQVAKFRELELV